MGLLSSPLHPMKARTAHDQTTRVAEMIDRVIAMNPRLRLARHYKERLRQAVSVSPTYIDDLIRSPPAPHEANAAAWSTDPLIRVFFATPDDLVKAFSRSEELRAYYARNSNLTEAYATLGMAMFQRHVLGVAAEGDEMRHDVPQTTHCFSDHRVRVCGKSDADLREEIARRLVDQLALEGLSRLAADGCELVAKRARASGGARGVTGMPRRGHALGGRGLKASNRCAPRGRPSVMGSAT
ncbi:hypothetical protein [Paraburkholderia sp. EG304]|uniref:hypothetical protein n=1 Tax=Paraburkholderia sp. EG304 TaxID=3237015 RepID=UPI00397CD618